MKRNALLILILSLFIGSCSRNKPWYVSDLTGVNQFTSGIEGPACFMGGSVFAVNYKNDGTIGITDTTGKSDVFITLPKGSIGNGIRFDKNYDMFIADYTGHNILVVKSGETKVTVFAHDSTMNQPNDLAVTSTGILFASDPNWKNNTGRIWRITPEAKMDILDTAMGTTNGIEVSPGDKFLYVNESIQRKIWRYTLDSAGNVSNKTLFVTFPDFGLDGMRCDINGNLYVCRHGKGTVAILSPDGKIIKEVKLKGKKPSNITFGGYDGKTCYITVQDRGCIEKFKCEIPGREWKL